MGSFWDQSRDTVPIITLFLFKKLSEHPLAIDAVWFGGGNKDGVYLIISGARRQQRCSINKQKMSLVKH
jgi:hypothetical protein